MKRSRSWDAEDPVSDDTPLSPWQALLLVAGVRLLVRLGYFNGRFGSDAADLQHLVNHRGNALDTLPDYTPPLPTYYRRLRPAPAVAVDQSVVNQTRRDADSAYADYLMYDLQPSAPPPNASQPVRFQSCRPNDRYFAFGPSDRDPDRDDVSYRWGEPSGPPSFVNLTGQ